MRGLYVYAIAAQPLRGRPRGVFGRPLRTMNVGSLHVVVESAVRAPKTTIRNLTRQSRTIAAMVAAGIDLLPARFGTFVSNRSELRSLITGRRADLVRALRLIQGRVQMTVRVRLGRLEAPPGPRRKAARGTAYLAAAAHRAHWASRDPLVNAVQRAAKPFARASFIEMPAKGSSTANVHHLIDRNDLSEYEERVGRVLYRRVVRAAISGPWAPFAFAEVA